MLNNKKEFKFKFGDKEVTLETGRLAKQADGSVLVSCNGTQVLVTACSATEAAEGQDFFPLLVDYKEKYYAAGRFLGGFNKREGRPSDDEILLMRIIDRPFRPMFPEGYFNETIITAQVISYDESADPEILAGLGASAALVISDIPFAAPVGFCKVGLRDGKYLLNPTKKELENSEIEMIVAAKSDAILMVEGEAKEVSEEQMLGAITFAHEQIKSFCNVMDKMQAEVGKAKREYAVSTPNKTLVAKIAEEFKGQAREAISTNDKLERGRAVSKITKAAKAKIKESPEAYGLTSDANFSASAYNAVDALMYEMMRADILNEEKRIGARGIDEVREIETEVNVLAKVHGSALFTRGETQVMGVVTLGGKEGERMKDQLAGTSYDKFYLHYTFPPFSVGEARGYRGVGRREIGHGNLAQRALKNIIDFKACPYTIRINCEVLESNGSSSMGSVCSGSMALMDAGVPMSGPVAGIAMGLIKSGENFKILTDILGDEDHLGDMDFKCAGTTKGITAIQMDIKIAGINENILKQALEQAKKGRMHILSKMSGTINTTSLELKDHAPSIVELKISPDRIGALIGPGGKNIKGIQESYGVIVECKDDGSVKVMGSNQEMVKEAQSQINLTINGPEIGKDYEAKVATLKEYGAFVDIGPGVGGLVHVSEIADERVNDVEQYLKTGDTVTVRVLEVDRFGKIKLSIKQSASGPLAKK
jgi:polyribonucleotide nucleotidyltransferase